MKKSSVVGFDSKKMSELIMKSAVQEQNRRLVEYAKEEIKRLGKMISAYPHANHMDRTGNLLNSLCWIVTYDGKEVESGFFREAKTNTYINRWGEERGMGAKGVNSSFLHEWFTDDMEEVNGRKLAEEFLKSFKGAAHKWKVAFAVLAPYWGYWESGHVNVKSGRFQQFQVMIHIYDDVRIALKPAETNLTVYVPKYIYKSQKWKKKFKNRVGVKKIGIGR